MMGWQLLLETALIGLLAALLYHAIRLERALGIVRRDRAELETLVQSFNESTKYAENGIAQLRTAADGAGRQIARQIELAVVLKDDLIALIERGENVADRMDSLARSNRGPDLSMLQKSHVKIEAAEAPQRVRSQAERDLLRALKVAR